VERYPTSFDVVVSQEGTSSMVAVRGELDLAATPVLAATLQAVKDAGRRDVVVDLGELAFVDVAGLRPLVAAATDGLSVRLRNPPRLAQLVLETCGLADVLAIEPSA
jgi:anti-anti-sigma factor